MTVDKKASTPDAKHPMEDLLRMDRMPHIWCPTCGLGTVVTAFASALEKLELPLDDVVVVSGIDVEVVGGSVVVVDGASVVVGATDP